MHASGIAAVLVDPIFQPLLTGFSFHSCHSRRARSTRAAGATLENQQKLVPLCGSVPLCCSNSGGANCRNTSVKLGDTGVAAGSVRSEIE